MRARATYFFFTQRGIATRPWLKLAFILLLNWQGYSQASTSYPAVLMGCTLGGVGMASLAPTCSASWTSVYGGSWACTPDSITKDQAVSCDGVVQSQGQTYTLHLTQWSFPIYACAYGGVGGPDIRPYGCSGAPDCPPGQTRNQTVGSKTQGVCIAAYSPANLGNVCPLAGNPINPGTGNKYQAEADYSGSGAYPLAFTRTYNSGTGARTTLGPGWQHSYERFISVLSSGGVEAMRPDGKAFTFTLVGGAYKAAETNDTLQALVGGWKYVTTDEETELYDATGKLLSITDRTGRSQLLAYDGSGRLASVTDTFGRALAFSYDAQNRISGMTDPAGGLYQYSYDAAGNLIGVTYPDGSSKTYHYEDSRFPHALTGISDENGSRYATYAYDDQGRAVMSQHAGGAGRVDLAYNADASTTVTDALGTARTYGFETILGMVKNAGVSQPGGAGCNAASSAVTHDAQGNVTTRDDFNGHRTRHWHDLTRNFETTRVEGLAVVNGSEQILPETRTFTTDWHAGFRLPVLEKRYTGGADANGTPAGTLIKTTAYTYDAQGNLVALSETDNVRNETRSRTWTYTSLGRVLSADGPRSDVADVTTYAYHPDNDPDLARRGQLWKVTNALGHVTEVLAYDLHGHPTQVRDANGLVTTLTYDARGRLTSRAEGNRVTAYSYDAAGNLVGLTLPDGSSTAFGYDAAHRLVSLQDAQGHRIVYTLDGLGNRVGESVHDAQGNPVRSLDRQFDALGRLWKEVRRVNGQAAVTEYAHDAEGNLTARTDPLGHAGTRAYDALDRLARSEDALQGHTNVARDVLDGITAVTDPKGLATVYETDAFGQVRKETSPDRGVTTYAYDPAGNLKTRTDARGVVTTYTYDALNRLTRKYWNPDIYADYQYDTGANGIGRLTRMTSLKMAATWSYDAHGAVASMQQSLQKQASYGSVVQSLQQAFDAAGRLTQMTYPSGKVVAFAYSQGRVSQVTVNGQVLMSGMQYAPFGPPQGWTWGNGTAYARSFDANGWPQSYPLGGLTRSLAYDAAGRITGYGHAGQANYDQSFAYDALDRLSGATTHQGSQAWQYDANGNRTQASAGANSYAYVYTPNTNRLQSVAGPLVRSYAYDAAGNVTGDGANSFLIDMTGRLRDASGTWGHTLSRVDGLGRRVQKMRYIPNAIPYREGTYVETFFAYDDAGHLIGEYDANGQAIQETVWLGDTPVAVLKASVLYYVHADHLDAPRVITDTQNRVVWRWDNADPFGVGTPNENPSGLGAFTYNLRFPGQFFDQETGVHYNYLRDSYDPRGGRYLQADPIGLAGGINTYAYVNNAPTMYADQEGLAPGPAVGWMGGSRKSSRSAYGTIRDWRAEGHRKFPGEANSDMRHCVISCKVAREFGQTLAHLAGTANEIQGLVLHDIPNLSSRLEGNSPWAFQLKDFEANEKGFQCAYDQHCGAGNSEDICVKCCSAQ